MTPWRLTVHCSDTEDGEVATVEAIRKAHIARGWTDIGYHFVIEPDGQVYAGRPLDQEGAGVQGDNEGNVHICLIGKGKFTQAQWDGLRHAMESLISTFCMHPWEIHCHNEFPSAIKQGKTCPNFSVNRLLAWYWLDDPLSIQDHLLPGEIV